MAAWFAENRRLILRIILNKSDLNTQHTSLSGLNIPFLNCELSESVVYFAFLVLIPNFAYFTSKSEL